MKNSNISTYQVGLSNIFLGHGALCVDNLSYNSTATFVNRFIKSANLIAEYKDQIEEEIFPLCDHYYRNMAHQALKHYMYYAMTEFGDDDVTGRAILKVFGNKPRDVKFDHETKLAKEMGNSYYSPEKKKNVFVFSQIDHEKLGDAVNACAKELLEAIGRVVESRSQEELFNFVAEYTKTPIGARHFHLND